MEVDTLIYCCGCLSTGRKMKSLNNFWTDDAFLKILSELPIQIDAYTWLCWECQARIYNFIEFKAQIKNCWKSLQDYSKEYHKSALHTTSRLTIHRNDCIDTNVIMKPPPVETNAEINLKAELLIKEEDQYSDDTRSVDVPVPKKKKLKKDKKVKVKKKNENVLFEEIILTKEEILEERAAMASNEEYMNAMFKCSKCIIPYANEDDLKDHEQAKHSLVSKYTCEYCSRGFPSNRPLQSHARRHTSRWKCCACAHRAPSAAAALAHHTARHSRPEFFDLAAKAYGNLEEKVEQSNDDSSRKSSASIPCEFCGKHFRWKASLRKHLETHKIESGHKRRPFCEPCGLTFTSSANLRKHINTSSKHQIQLKLRKLNENPSKETNPIQQAKDIENIKSSINTKKEQFPCPQCDKKFQWKGNLWRHLQSHAARANGELVCKPCERTFSSIATYQQHMRVSRRHVSENEFKYMCSDCGKRFCNKIKLSDHINWDHLKKYTHTCTDCQKVFKSHTSLYLHRQVVHKLYNADHLCDHCGKSFPNKTKLRCHITALHTRESPYKCRACSARFRWDSCLSRHMRRVHGNKPAPGRAV